MQYNSTAPQTAAPKMNTQDQQLSILVKTNTEHCALHEDKINSRTGALVLALLAPVFLCLEEGQRPIKGNHLNVGYVFYHPEVLL